MNNKKVARLLDKGLKFDTLKMLSESQIDELYGAVIGEQDTASAAAEKVTQQLQQARQMTAQLKQDLVGEEEVEENEDGLEDLARQDYTGQEGPHDEDDMAPDGMDDDSDNNRQMMGEVEEVNPWAICTSSLGLEGRERDSYTDAESEKFERCVTDVKKQNEVRQIEESLVSLIRKYIPETTMTKKDLMEMLEEAPGTKEAPVKTPTRTKPDRKTPYKPKHKPAPKASETETAPTRTKPGTKEKPGKKTPYLPKHKPAPKAVEKGLPDILQFNNLNIKFRNEK